MKERAESWKDSKHETNTSAEEIFTSERWSKHPNIDTTLPAQSKPYIICNNLKRKRDNKGYEFVKIEEKEYFYWQQSFSKILSMTV